MSMIIKIRALNALIRLLQRTIQRVGGDVGTRILAHMSGEIVPVVSERTDHGMIHFYCPGTLPVYRAKTLLTKEPETIQWIDGFNKGDVLWDIGANVGVYSLYAALRGSPVVAFEPSPGNYYLISKNVEINEMDSQVSVYCIAFSNETGLDHFYMANTEIGGALNSFGEAIDQYGNTYSGYFRQATVGFSIDEFVEKFDPLFPNHIKIDVDGLEGSIIDGGNTTLSDQRLKSLLVELDTERQEYAGEVIDKLRGHGLELAVYNTEGYPGCGKEEGPGLRNHIFVRT
jgi:FkbM family methyltransferase